MSDEFVEKSLLHLHLATTPMLFTNGERRHLTATSSGKRLIRNIYHIELNPQAML